LFVAALFAGAAATVPQQPLSAIHFIYEECDNGLPYCTHDVCECEAELLCDEPDSPACDPGEECVGVIEAGCFNEDTCGGSFACQPI
jgi:hypothetical protein